MIRQLGHFLVIAVRGADPGPSGGSGAFHGTRPVGHAATCASTCAAIHAALCQMMYSYIYSDMAALSG